MIRFKKREIKRTKTLGERLKAIRGEAGLSLEEAEKGTEIQKKYLQAIEEGNYSFLPASVYIKSYLKVYAEFLQVSPEMVLSIYEKEANIVGSILKNHRTTGEKFKPMPKSILTPHLLRNLIIFLVIAACFAYLGLEIKKIVTPPFLEITSPADNIVIDKNSIEILGKTEPESTVTINGQEVFLNADGNFQEKVELVEGINTIEISSQKKQSKKNIIYRHVQVEINK